MSIVINLIVCPHRLVVRTLASQAGNRDSQSPLDTSFYYIRSNPLRIRPIDDKEQTVTMYGFRILLAYFKQYFAVIEARNNGGKSNIPI